MTRHGRKLTGLMALIFLLAAACTPTPPPPVGIVTPAPTALPTPIPTPGHVYALVWAPERPTCWLYTNPSPYEVACETWQNIELGDVWP